MTEQEKRERIRVLIEELMGMYRKIDKENLDEERESEIYIEVNKLSPDPEWSNYIGGSVKDENGNFISEAYFNNTDDVFDLNYAKFLDKIFSHKENVIEMGYTPTKDNE